MLLASPDGTRRTLDGKIKLWFAILGGLMVLISGLIFASISSLTRSSAWVQHSYRVLGTLDQAEDLFDNAQAAERGFVATCKPALLSPFRIDLPRLYDHLARLQVLTRADPQQQTRITALRKALNAEIGRMGVAVRDAGNGEQIAAEAGLAAPAQIKAIADIRTAFKTIETDERTLLTRRLARVDLFGNLTMAACALGLAAAFGILGFVFWLVRRETRRRKLSEDSLHRSNDRLERSLKELQQHNEFGRSVRLLGELLQTCRSMDEALAIAARHLHRLFPISRGIIGLFADDGEEIQIAKRFGAADDGSFGGQFATQSCWALRRGHLHMSLVDGREPRCEHIPEALPCVECIPLVAQGHALGLLSIAFAREDGPTALEQRMLQTIAEQVSLALANLKMQETLRAQSLRDPLTGVFNRRYLDEVLPREIGRARRAGQPVAVAMLDIDHFKRFNDSHGHDGGDALLIAFAETLVRHCRAEDVVCRFGGEEFAIVLPGADLAAARERAEALCAATRRLKVVCRGERLGPVTVSIGLAAYPDHGQSGEDLITAADGALYDAKEGGRDRVVSAGAPAEDDRQQRLPLDRLAG